MKIRSTKRHSARAERQAGGIERRDRFLADLVGRQVSWLQEVLADPERRSLWRSILVAIVIPFLLVGFFRAANNLISTLATPFLWVALPIYVFLRPLYRWSQNDGSLSENVFRDLRFGLPLAPVGTDNDWKRWPVLTLALVLTNVCVFYAGVDQFTYALQMWEPSGWQWSNWTSMFLHANSSHLWGNMIFLAVFAAPLEGRIGRGRLLLYYLLMGTAANAAIVLSELAIGSEYNWSLGASGAISGVMGLYMVRCCFGRVSFGIPILGALALTLPVVLRIRVSPLVLLTLFFLSNLSGARATLEGVPTHIGYAAHVGGYLLGLAIGYGSGLFRDGVRESLAGQASLPDTDGDYGRSREALDALLKVEPDHVDALLARARRDSRFGRGETARRDYQRVVQLLLDSDRARAADVFLEYYQKFLAPVEIRQQLVLTPALVDLGKCDIAARALELATQEPDIDRDARSTALLYQGKLLTELDLPEAAEKIYKDLMNSDPESPQAEIAEARLDSLRRRWS
jgi:membrane associated rhomboid family serine protease